ncbi:hypothetical protein M911_13300 [Ectothiorhodospira haloalkaliphila]|uniref:Lipoprotein n=1 Tax=Ectothiorhodospira haloalkaliphila TaxID=421628 RepID=W8KWL6_9GAMM|nr:MULTISPECIES: hypothetical protein [Ectothiorhodospira]AHK79966.1 hypothetical protein M911_13300 [Ectothiorhodospira haloalkaliphila]MCG5493614.1 hypothetical protein [Ectothiorhodospira variabilis]MCG5496961.1 hypothetical protein [Ectothiorhodospira variabilis]MCG5502943.1 hypothetical protein [Ectothiorhodospira variabilis]MCG5506269.1 hypothetical protein [Ectothiorhodospira variabilis]
MKHARTALFTALAAALVGAGCQSTPSPDGSTMDTTTAQQTAPEAAFSKPGFRVQLEDGRLWVLKQGQEKPDRPVILIGAGPQGMTLKAVDRETALEYVAAKPGFDVSVEDGRLWVLREGQEKPARPVMLINAGPQGMTLRAHDRETALEYLATKPGFDVSVEDGRLWVLREGQEKPARPVMLINAGPQGMTLRAPDRDTALAYLATKPGYRAEAEDGRVWILKPDQEKTGKHVARIGAGPQGATLRGVDSETLDRYMAYQP